MNISTYTRIPNIPFSNQEIATNMYLCNKTPYCRGFDMDPSLSKLALYKANKLVSKTNPNQTNYFYTMAYKFYFNKDYLEKVCISSSPIWGSPRSLARIT